MHSPDDQGNLESNRSLDRIDRFACYAMPINAAESLQGVPGDCLDRLRIDVQLNVVAVKNRLEVVEVVNPLGSIVMLVVRNKQRLQAQNFSNGMNDEVGVSATTDRKYAIVGFFAW